MTENSMVCNGYKENRIEKCSSHELFSFNKLKREPANTENSEDTMTIGSIPFPEFDHLYASSVEDSKINSNTMNAARSYLNSCHLNIIEEQAKSIELQSQEILKLRKQNESLIARIERMNRRLNLNQCSRRISIKCSNQGTNENVYNRRNDKFSDNADHKYETSSCDESNFGHVIHKSNMGENRTANFRIRFRQKEARTNEEHRKCNKMVRFVEAKRSNSLLAADKSKRNSAQAVDEKLKLENAVLFLKTAFKDKPAEEVVPRNHVEDSDSEDTAASKRKRLRFPIITAHEPFYMAVREDIETPVTYTPTALEVPSYRITERDNINPSDVPTDYYEDVTEEAAKERHLRLEISERKRKKWDVQRIRELRQNEILKEKLRRRKSRWSKLESPKMTGVEGAEQISTLFPDIKNIEKIMITNVVPVTALGVSIAKIPSWGTDFHTPWMNDGTVDANQFEESESVVHQQHHHSRETRNRLV